MKNHLVEKDPGFFLNFKTFERFSSLSVTFLFMNVSDPRSKSLKFRPSVVNVKVLN